MEVDLFIYFKFNTSDCIVHVRVCVYDCSLARVCGFTGFPLQYAAAIQFLLNHQRSVSQVKHSLAQ